jgi:hypothetical protein
VHAIRQSLGLREGDELCLADCTEITSKRHGDPLPMHLRSFLHEWAAVHVPQRWEEYAASHEEGSPWLNPGDVHSLARYLRDYLLSEEVFADLLQRLSPVVHLKTRDEAARRRARRKYTEIIMNDFLLNPGGGTAPIPSADEDAGEPDGPPVLYDRFGLMAAFIRRWNQRLPRALAQGAGNHVQIPPGNSELAEILQPFEK